MSIIFTKAIFLTAMLVLTGCGKHFHYDSEFDQKASDIKALLDATFQSGEINGNVLVKLDDKTVFSQSYGFSDGERNQLLNARYRFNLGSIYKEFPAVAIMQLQENKMLKVDDVLAKYLSDLPEWSTQISIANLLQYSSGLPKVNWGKHKNISDEDIWSDLLAITELEFQPGNGYLYSNVNPFLLQKIIEQVSGQSFYSYAQKNLFKPSGMSSTILSPQFPYTNRSLMAIPFNHEFKEDGFPIRVSLLYAATADDLFKWNRSLRNNKLINHKSFLYLTETAKVNQDKMQSPLGQTQALNEQLIQLQHHGSSGNFESIVTHAFNSHVTVIIMTNKKQQNVHQLTEKIIQIMR